MIHDPSLYPSSLPTHHHPSSRHPYPSLRAIIPPSESIISPPTTPRQAAEEAALSLEDFEPYDITVRALLGRLSALCVSHSKSVLYGTFARARRPLNLPKRRFPTPPGQAEEQVVVVDDELLGWLEGMRLSDYAPAVRSFPPARPAHARYFYQRPRRGISLCRRHAIPALGGSAGG